MKRRSFILMGAAGAAAISIPAYNYYFGDVAYDPLLAQPKSLSLIWEDHEIQAIGKEYIKQTPDEQRVRTLVNLLSDGSSGISALENKTIEDFKAGKTVMVDGWILSATEARQCALASTSQPKKK